MADSKRRVVVTGLGVISPIGNDVDTFWRRLVAGESGVGEITRFDTTGYKVHIAAEVQDFVAEDYIDKRKARRLDLFSRYAVAAAIDASKDADFDPKPEAERVGAVMASGVGGLQTLHVETDKLLNQGPDRTNPLLVPMMIPNMGAAQVSLELGTKGPLSATCTACAAASDAIGYAWTAHPPRRRPTSCSPAAARRRSARSACPAFAATRALSTHNDDPQGASRPFDVNRDGFVIGEGAGVLVLEELEHAKARGAHIYAELAGNGMSSDAFHMTLPDESGEAQARAVLTALDEAGIDPSEVDYINAHGTSTGPGDIAETRAIKQALGRPRLRGRHLLQQVDDRSLPRRRRRPRGGRDRPDHRQRPDPADDQPHTTRTPSATWTTSRSSPALPRSTWRSATASASAATTSPWSSAATTADRGLRAGRAGGRSTS